MSENKPTAQDMQNADSMRFLTLVSLGFFIFFFYIAYLGVNGLLTNPDQSAALAKPEVYGVAEESPELSTTAELKLNNTTNGIGYLEMDLSDPVRVSGGELYFSIEGDLDVQNIICSNDFSCVVAEFDNESMTLVFLRTPDKAGTEMRGSSTVASIVYEPSTSGELVLNSVDQLQSNVLTVGTAVNLLPDEVTYLPIGQYPN